MTALSFGEFPLSTRIPLGAERRTVPRPRLQRMLTEALTSGVHPFPAALVCAPAGSGKTRLLADWARDIADTGHGPTLAWLTVDDRYNDRELAHRAILRALIETGNPRLQQVCETLGGRSPGIGAQLAAALHEFGEQIWMVFDDAHLLRDSEVLADLESFMRWQPPTVRTIISGRFEPPLALQRLRLDGKLFTLGASDLAFTAKEAAGMLTEHGVRLRPEDLAALMDRTEGWAAGIRLAGMSLEGHEDPSALIAEFTGTRRAVADYLIEEVLTGQSEDMREFLLRTSVPASFTVELAEQLTGCTDAHAKIDWLEHHNFLISRITDSPHRFRYHPLLRSYLRAEISRIGQVEVEQLELTAARWHAEFGEDLLALEHAVAARDHNEIVTLLAETALSLIPAGHGAAVDRLLEEAPRLTQKHPTARLIRAAAALSSGNDFVAASTLELLDRKPVETPADGISESHRHLLLRESLRVQVAIRTGNIAEALQRLRWVDTRPSGDPELDAFVLLQQGRGLLFLGQVERSETALRKSLAHARRAGGLRTEMYGLGSLAALALARGDVTQAAVLVDQALSIGRDESASGETSFELIRLVDSWCHQIRLDGVGAATIAAASAEALRRKNSEDAGFAEGMAILFGLDESPHRHAAVTALHANSPVASSLPVPPAVRAVLLPAVHYAFLRSGEPRWARELASGARRLLGSTGDTAILDAIEHLHAHRLDLARKTLQPVLDGHSVCSAATNLIAAWLVDVAIALGRKHDSRAHSALIEALRLAAPQSVLRPFHDCLPQVRELLIRSTGRYGALESFAEQLRLSFPRAHSPMTDTLTRRELELLVELPSWRTAEQIATDLCVSVNTVKTHLRGIYRKLGVTSRRDAVAAAQQSGLL